MFIHIILVNYKNSKLNILCCSVFSVFGLDSHEASENMASKRKQTRVSKPRGLYNQYLRENDPLEHIPESSKRQLLSDTLHYGKSVISCFHLNNNWFSLAHVS